MRLIFIILATAILYAPSPRDIDVGMPPGSPLEWGRDLNHPTPTGGRPAVPTVHKPPVVDPKNPPKGGGTQVAKTPETYDYGVTNLYAYFGVTTHDIMTHVLVTLPAGGLTHKGDVATGGGSVSGVVWIYPPYHTTETVWIGAAGCLRAILHPEVTSVPELVAYLCEVGEPALIGCNSIRGPVGERVKKLVTPLNDDKMPSFKPGGSPLETMVNRLVTIELTSGFPHSLDPTFARRSLSFGDEAYKQIVEATKSDHKFLARNAVSVLANFKTPEAADVVRKIFTGSPDACMKYRALSGIGRRRDKASVDAVKAGLSSADEVHRAACAYTLGMIGDPRALANLMSSARGTTDRDFLWSLLPAIARLSSTKEHADFFTAIAKKVPTLPPLVRNEEAEPDRFNGKPMTPPKPEPADTKLRVLEEMCFLGRVMAGDEEAGREMLTKLTSGMDSFQKANWYLVVDAAAKLGKPALQPMKGMFGMKFEAALQQAALIRMSELDPEHSWLQTLIGQSKPAVGALALMILADRNEKLLRETATQMISAYQGNNPGQAFLAAVALQLLAKIPSGNGNKVEQVIAVAEKALETKGWASRVDDQEPDITKAKIQIHPPLLEVVVIELGRLGDPKAIPILIKVANSRADRGRAEAILALGAFDDRDAKDTIIAALDDAKDGWVRHCAYIAAKKLSAQDNFCDWIFGSATERKGPIEKYRAWLETQAK